MANTIKFKRASGSDPSASDLAIGEPGLRTDTAELFFKKDDGTVAKVSGGGGGPNFKYLELRNAANNGAASFPGNDFTLVTAGTTTAISPSAANTLLVSVSGVIQKPNAGTSTSGITGFIIDGSRFKTATNLPAAPDFIVYQESGGIGEPSDNTVTSAKIVDGAIVNADINASAAIDVSKLSGVLPLAGGTLTGSLTISNAAPNLIFTDTDHNPDFNILASGGVFRIQDHTNVNNLMTLDSSKIQAVVNFDALAGLDVTGDITGTGKFISNSSSSGDYVRLYAANGTGKWDIYGNGANLRISDNDSAGSVVIDTNLDVGAGLDVTGAIKSTGNISLDNSSELGVFEADTSLGFTNSAKLSFDFSSNLARIRSSGNGSFSARPLTFNIVNTEAMRIDTSGRVIVGSTSHIGGAQFVVMGGNLNTYGAMALGNKAANPTSNTTFAQFRFNSGASGTRQGASITAETDGNWTDGSSHPSRMAFFTTTTNATGSTERMRIDSSGNVMIGGTSSSPENDSSGGNFVFAGSKLRVGRQDNPAAAFARNTGTGTIVHFNYNGSVKGQISTNGSTISYQTSSDYRLKENEVAISDGITRLKQLKPYRFNFKETPDKLDDGFFAHEVQSVVPGAVSGMKDAVYSEDDESEGIKAGDIIPQGLDNSKLVPLLVAALQEAIGRIEALEAK